MRRHPAVLVLIPLLLACDDADPDVCGAAVEHARSCGLAVDEPDHCDRAAAEAVLETDCDRLLTTGKADAGCFLLGWLDGSWCAEPATPSSPARLDGVAEDRDGWPIAFAALTLTGDVGALVALSDADGRVTWGYGWFPPGWYTLKIRTGDLVRSTQFPLQGTFRQEVPFADGATVTLTPHP